MKPSRRRTLPMRWTATEMASLVQDMAKTSLIALMGPTMDTLELSKRGSTATSVQLRGLREAEERESSISLMANAVRSETFVAGVRARRPCGESSSISSVTYRRMSMVAGVPGSSGTVPMSMVDRRRRKEALSSSSDDDDPDINFN
jgi:hypothetical protein